MASITQDELEHGRLRTRLWNLAKKLDTRDLQALVEQAEAFAKYGAGRGADRG